MDLEGSFVAVVGGKNRAAYEEAKSKMKAQLEQEEAGFPKVMEQFPNLPRSRKSGGNPVENAREVPRPKETPIREERGDPVVEEADPYAVTPMTTFGFETSTCPNVNEITAVMSKIGHALECRLDPPTWKAKEVADRGPWKRFLKEYLRYLAASGTSHPRTQVDADLMQALQWILPEKDWATMTALRWLREMDAFLTHKHAWAVGMETLTLEVTAGSTPDWQTFVKDIEALIQVSTSHVSEKKKAIWRAVEKARFIPEAQKIEQETRDPKVGIEATIRIVADVLSTTATYTKAALWRGSVSKEDSGVGTKRVRDESSGSESAKVAKSTAMPLARRGGSERGCFVCRQRGHMARECPNAAYVTGASRSGYGTGASRAGVTSVVQSGGKGPQTGGRTMSAKPRKSIINALDAKAANCWVKLLDGSGRTLPALMDSGSPHYSFVEESTAERLGFERLTLEDPVSISVGNGAVVEITTCIEVRLLFPTGKKVCARLLILRGCPVEVVVGHDLIPTMEAMARQVRVARKGTGQPFSRDMKRELTAIRSVYCVLESDSIVDYEGVPEMEEELATLPTKVDESNHLELPGVEPGSKIYVVCMRRRKIFSQNINALPARVRAMPIKLHREGEWPAEMRQRVRQIPEAYREEVGKMLGEMLDLGVIERVAESEFYSQLLVVRKKDASLRLCVDFRALNALTVRNRHPLPLIRELVMKLKGKKVLGVLDLASGYWQTPLEENSRKYTVFATTQGLFQFTRVAFGLCNAPSYFQEVIQNEVLGHLRDAAIVYIDDILIFGEDEDDFLRNLDRVLSALEKHGIVVKPQKCRLGLASVEYVGLSISGDTVDMTEDRKQAIAGISKPQTVTQMRTFLGIVNYFRSHIPQYAKITAGLYGLIEGKEGKRGKQDPLEWTEKLSEEFETVKEAAASAETLFHFEEGLEIILRTDASDFAVGGVVTQVTEEGERPILFLSKKLSRAQRNYSVSDKEMLAIFFCIRTAHQLLAGRRFTVYSDHRPLESTKSSASPRIERMKIALQEYSFEIKYLKGEENATADLMSRLLVMQEVEKAEGDRTSLIADHHNGFTGHLGRDATVQEIRRAGHNWAGIQDDVSQFVQDCLICQKGRSARGLRHGQLYLEARGPGQEWGVDAMELEKAGGHKYVLVVLCHFTRFTHLAPLRSLSSRDCEAVMEKLFLTFGRPDIIRTDNAKTFKSEMIAELLHRYDIRAVDIPPYDSRSNSMVERAIQEVRRHLYAVREESGLPWPQALPRVQFIMNRRAHTATGYAPADLLFGRLGALGYGEMEGAIRRARGDGERWLEDIETAGIGTPMEEGKGEQEVEAVENGRVELGTAAGGEIAGAEGGGVEGQGTARIEYISESERERARVVQNQEELVAIAMAQQQVRAAKRAAARDKETALQPGDRVWVKTRSTKRNSKREFWLGPETVVERRGDIVVVTGPERNHTVVISKLKRAGEGLREGGEVTAILDHDPYRPGLDLERYKLKVTLQGDQNVHWRNATELADHVLFHRYALGYEDLTHLVEE